MIKRTVCLILAIVCMAMVSIPVGAEEQSQPVSVSYKNKDKVKSAILDFIEENKASTPSVSITVFDDKQDICNIAYGYANKAENIAVNEDTVYEWGSISKLLVWTSAMQLYEQGKLDLNEDIRTYLPKGFLNNLSYDDPITMIDLMNHSGGFQETVSEIETEDINEINPLDEELSHSAPAQVARPGETVSYSNWGAALGGYIVSCISGMDYADYVHKYIFDKLGMEHTYLRPDASDNEWAAKKRSELHSYAISFSEQQELTDMGEGRAYITLYPAGSTTGTISDLAKFAKALLSNSKDCPLFEKDDTLDVMVSPSRTFGDGSPRICHGMFYALYGDGLYGHGGNTKGCSSDLQLDLKNKTGYVMMINTQSDRVYTNGLPELLYGKKEIPAQSNFEKVDISGHYKFGRSSGGAGMLKILSPVEDGLPIEKSGSDFTSTNGITRITQITDIFMEVSLINDTKIYYGVKKDTAGNVTMLESYHAIDLMKISDTQYYTEWVMIFVLLVSLILPVLLFIVHIFRIRKFRNTNLAKFKKTELFAGLMPFTILLGTVVIFMNTRAFFYGGKSVYAAIAISLCVLTLAEMLLFICCRFYKTENKPERTIILNIETICSILTIISIVYWRLFQWWGF